LVLLAGGAARRMGGGDKCLLEVAGRPILAHLIARLAPQVRALALNANGDPTRFVAFGLVVLPDPVDGRPGPLAGVLAAMRWAATLPGCVDVVTAPADGPFLPRDLVARLLAARAAAGVPFACAASGGFTHPPVGLWPVALADALAHAVTVEDVRKVDAFTARWGCATANFATDPLDPFFNANTPEDLALAERMAAMSI
jgi:molybdopterin-guanine dinucleotide biosynthesis protein A